MTIACASPSRPCGWHYATASNELSHRSVACKEKTVLEEKLRKFFVAGYTEKAKLCSTWQEKPAESL